MKNKQTNKRVDIPTMINTTDDPEANWRGLAIAIVQEAANDYLKILRREKHKGRKPEGRMDKDVCKKEVLEFFYGDWFSTICDLDPGKILDGLHSMDVNRKRI